jgi:hypothetical protein
VARQRPIKLDLKFHSARTLTCHKRILPLLRLESRLNSDIEAHLRRSVNFPSPPGVATHIIELARDPEIEMGKVAKALSMDSALASKVLRIANAARAKTYDRRWSCSD